MYRKFILLCLLAFGRLALAATPSLQLQMPVACQVMDPAVKPRDDGAARMRDGGASYWNDSALLNNTDCYIHHYVDLKPGPEYRDYRGGKLTYNNHKGTDFGIATYQQMRDGVAVLAAAPGKVLRIRDGKPDLHRQKSRPLNHRNLACGNGVVIRHSNGYETQYCHLRRHSIVVKPGTVVNAGDRLGMIGASGEADFPHLHFTVRNRAQQVVDPFQAKLWQTPPPYQNVGVIDAALTQHVPRHYGVLDKPDRRFSFSLLDSRLVAWVRVYGVQPGLEQRFRFFQPNGLIYRKPISHRINKSYDEWFSFAGFKIKPDMPTGDWVMQYQVRLLGEKQWQTLRELPFSLTLQ